MQYFGGILFMSKRKRLSFEEKLLEALTGTNEKKEEQTLKKKKSFRMLRIDVKSDDGDDVNLKIPLEFARVFKGGKIGRVNFSDKGIDFDAVLEMIDAGADGELVNVTSSDGDRSEERRVGKE